MTKLTIKFSVKLSTAIMLSNKEYLLWATKVAETTPAGAVAEVGLAVVALRLAAASPVLVAKASRPGHCGKSISLDFPLLYLKIRYARISNSAVAQKATQNL